MSRSSRIANAVHTAKRFRQRMMNLVTHGLTHEDAVQMFVAPEHQTMALEAPKHFITTYSRLHARSKYELSDGYAADVVVACEDIINPAPPNPRRHTFNLEHPAFPRLLSYVEAQSETIKAWGLVIATLQGLSEECSSEAQMRYFWPSLLSLYDHSNDEEAQKFADTIRAPKTPRVIPALPQWLISACRETSVTIATATLLDDVTPAPSEVSVQIMSLSGWQYLGRRIDLDLPL